MSSKISLIIQREFNQRVRKRSFIVVTLLMPLLMIALVAVPVLIAMYGSQPGTTREIVVIDPSQVIAPKLTGEQGLVFQPTEMTYDSARVAPEYKNAFGFLVVSPNIVEDPSGLALYTRESSTMTIEGAIRGQVSNIIRQERIAQADIPGLDSVMQRVNVRAHLATYRIDAQTAGEEAKASSSAASMGISYVMSFIVYMFIFIYGAQVMQGVIEEKSNRIVEVIVSSVKPFQLMMGKIIGIALVALTQFLIWVVLIGGAMLVFKNLGAAATADMPGELTSVLNTLDGIFLLKMVGVFLIYFIGGYLLYAAMYAAIGSAVESAQDAQQLQWPITIPLILAIMVMVNVIRDPTSGAAFWFSMIPFTSPIIMPARIPYGVPFWEMAVSVGVLFLTFLLMVAFAAKIYRTGIFMYGKKPTFAEMIRWIRYKG